MAENKLGNWSYMMYQPADPGVNRKFDIVEFAPNLSI